MHIMHKLCTNYALEAKVMNNSAQNYANYAKKVYSKITLMCVNRIIFITPSLLMAS